MQEIQFKTFTTPYSGKTTDIIYGIEKALKAGYAVRVVSTYTDSFCPGELVQERRQRTENEYLRHMQYIYGEELQTVTNEDNMCDYYRLAWRGGVFKNRYRITWETLENHRYHQHEFNGLMEAKNMKHARDRFRIWWDAKEFDRKPHPRYAFHVEVKREI